MKQFTNLRILHLPSATGGQAWALSRAEKDLGFKSFNLIYKSSKFGYKSDQNLDLRKYNRLIRYIIQTYCLLVSLFKYDIFHFYFGQTFLPLHIDLPILKLFRKKIFFTFQGSDIRQKKESYTLNGVRYNLKFDYIIKQKSDLIKKIKIRFIHFFADESFVLNPDLLLVSPKSQLLLYSNFDIWQTKNIYINKKKDAIFRIIHAPSKKDIKGTKFVIDACNTLSKEFPQLKLDLVENVTTDVVLNRAKKADLAIDQLLIGWYGGFAVEMMSLGVPVMCYIDTNMLSYIAYKKEMPIINTNTKNITKKIKYILNNRYILKKISQQSREYIEHNHNPLKIAKFTTNRYINAYR